MNRSLLLIVACVFSASLFAQVQNKVSKTRSKSAAPYTTSFKSVTINGQNSLKASKVTSTTSLYTNVGTSTLTVPSKQVGIATIIYGADSLAPIYFERKNESKLKSASAQTPEQHCFSFLNDIKHNLHVTSPLQSFVVSKSTTDALGQQHVRLSQKYNGINVYSSDFYVHFAGDNEIMNGKYSVINSSINTLPKISKQQALQIASNDLLTVAPITELPDNLKDIYNYSSPTTDTVILEDKRSFAKFSLAYHIIIRPNAIDEWYYFVNAANGNIIKKFNNTKYDGPATASATNLNGVSTTINTYLQKGKYSLIDASESMFDAAKGEGIIQTLDAQNTAGNTYAEITSVNNTWNNPKAVSAHNNAKQAYLYFKNTFNRNSINGTGGNIYSFINVTNSDGSQMDNAFWSDKIMCYGNGNVGFEPLMKAIDVAAHEMAHGVTQNTAGLEYEGESGAINESMSDIFGAMVDRSNWYIGEEVTKTSYIASGRLRDMSDPHNGTSDGNNGWQPKHTSEKYTGTDDHGGVHTNSGICNYAYYLLATAITKEKAEQIYYRALTTYLTKSSQFIDLRLAVIKSAKDLYTDGSNEVTQCVKSFDAVGINEEQPNNYTQTYPVNPGQDYLLLYNTDISDDTTLYRSSVAGTIFQGLTTTNMQGKASVVDDGSVAYFVSADKEIKGLYPTPNSTDETVISPDKFWQNVAVSKDGNRMAAITSYIDTAIYVYDFGSDIWRKFILYNPSTEGENKNGGVLYADAIEFDHTGEYLIYDSYNVIRSSATDSISYWDIGLIKVWDKQSNTFGDGTISKLFGNLPDSVSIGNPVFSKNSPNIIAFDYEFGGTEYAIYGLNLEDMTLGKIADNNTFGYPSFSKLDDKIAYHTINNSDKWSVATVGLNADKISSTETPLIIVTDAAWPVYYATGTRILGLAPKANFTVSYKSGAAPLSTSFFDQSTNEPTSWLWTFESGNPSSSTAQNPNVTYNSIGTYAVTLKATNGFGNNTVVKSGYINIGDGTAIGEITLKDKISVYPNPSTGIFEVSAKEFGNDYEIEVYNNQGIIVKKIISQNNSITTQINLTGYPLGLYLVRISSGTESFTTRIVKN